VARRFELQAMIAKMTEAIQAAALQPAQWQEVADRLPRCVPGTKIVMQVWDGLSPPLPLISSGWSSTTIQAYSAYYCEINPWRPAWLEMPHMRACWADDYLPNAELRKTEYYADMLRPEGEVDGATGIKLVQEDGRLAMLAVHYDRGRGEEMHAVLRPLVQGLAVSMRQALDVNRVIYGSTPSLGLDLDLLHALLHPAFIVDRHCRVLAANAKAQELFSDRGLHVGARDLLRFADAGTDKAFAERIRRLCSVGSDAASAVEDLSLTLPRGAFAMTIMPVSQNLRSMALSGVLPIFLPEVVALVVMRPRAETTPAETLQRRYGLTKSEARLAAALPNGGTLLDVASRLGISYETARTQLRAVFVKTGVNRQSELVALVVKQSRSN
jgi:DNA-binding CsgD family transcriptional regulator